jgi:AraC-like DNA-binding protein
MGRASHPVEAAIGEGGALELRLFTCALLPISALEWSARDVRDGFWRLYVNFRDGAALELPGPSGPSWLELEAGGVYLVPSGVRFSCVCTAPLDHFYVHFDVVGWPPSRALGLWNCPFRAPDPGGLLLARVREFVRSLTGLARLDAARRCRLKGLVWDALAASVEALTPEQREGLARLEGHGEVAPALRFIESNLQEPLPNALLARQCHWSEDHFIRRFREAVGQSPAQYVTERRVALASQRLLFSESSIDEVARDCGFGNRFYFSRVFARHTGMAPAAYRRAPRV